ncbi:MAG TPA: hypothetical protein VG736_13515 [Vicinamibacterales bacterium]|jgi:hypothetical protein|nr:hypothetical protein [Vicinamibacterales bacterium]
MTDERDEVLDELRAAVNVEPSPEFEARVRLATRESRSRGAVWAGRGRAWMWGAVASGAVAAAALVAVLLRSGSAVAPSTVTTVPQSVARNTPSRSVQQAEAVAAARPAPLRRAAAHGAPRRTTTAALEARRAPEVLVPPDQAIALARLLAGVSEGRVMIGATKAADADVTIAPLSDPTPVTITEVRIDSLPVPAGGAS